MKAYFFPLLLISVLSFELRDWKKHDTCLDVNGKFVDASSGCYEFNEYRIGLHIKDSSNSWKLVCWKEDLDGFKICDKKDSTPVVLYHVLDEKVFTLVRNKIPMSYNSGVWGNISNNVPYSMVEVFFTKNSDVSSNIKPKH
jgi:hypothetical protein